MAYIISSGESSDGILLTNDSMTVLDGGVANNTEANDYSFLYISSGGTANNTEANDYSYLYFFSGGTANGTTLNINCELHVFSGGVTNNTEANDNSCLYVSSGGTVNSAILNIDCGMEVISGGTANYTTVNSNSWLCINDGAIANHTTINATSNIEVYGTMNDTTINRGGEIRIYDEGAMNGVIVNCGGKLSGWIYEDGSVVGIVENGGYVYFEDETLVSFQSNAFSEVTLSANESATVHSGTTANNVTVDPGGKLKVFSGGIAKNIAENGGYVELDNDAQATFRTNTVNGLTLLSGASATVHSGTTINDAAVNQGGLLRIYSGGIANNIAENGGYVDLDNDAQATFQANTVNGLTLSSASATAHSGTTVNNARIGYGGLLFIAGGTADGVTVASRGHLQIQSGGTATGINASQGARMDFTVTPETVIAGNSNGVAFDIRNGIMTDYSSVSGSVTIAPGAEATGTILYGGVLDVSGGSAVNTIVSSGGALELHNGAADGILVSSDGILNIFGGTATGINASLGAQMDFTVTSDTIIQGTSGTIAFDFRDGIVSDSIISGYVLTIGTGAVATANTVIEASVTGSDGLVTGTTVCSNGILTVTGGSESIGSATDTVVNEGGTAVVSSGGAADSILVKANGSLTIAAGAMVTNLTAEEGSELFISVSPETFITGTVAGNTIEVKGGTFTGYNILHNDTLEVLSGTVADCIGVKGGYLYVSSGGTATDID